jgi:hypothetical protein
MAVSRNDGLLPLHLHAVYRILREMRIEQQEMGGVFSYADFKKRIAQTEMTPPSLGRSPSVSRLWRALCQTHKRERLIHDERVAM